MQEKVNTMESDIDIIYNRTGGRAVNGMQPDPFLTMADLQVLAADQCARSVVSPPAGLCHASVTFFPLLSFFL